MEHANNKKWVISIAVFLVVASVAVFLGMEIKQINDAYPQVKSMDVECGASSEVQPGIDMSVVDAAMYSMEEAQERYGEEFVEEIGQDYAYRTIEVTVLLKNKTDEMQDMALYDIYIEQEDYCNGLAPEVFFGIGNETDYVTIDAGGELEVTLGYIVYEKQFGTGEWETMTVEDFFLARMRYPEKLRWKV